MSFLVLLGLAVSFASIALYSFHLFNESKHGVFDFFNIKNLFLVYFILQTAIYAIFLGLSQHPTYPALEGDLLSENSQTYYLEATLISFLGLGACVVGYMVGPRISHIQSGSSNFLQRRPGFLNIGLFPPHFLLGVLVILQWISSYIFFSD